MAGWITLENRQVFRGRLLGAPVAAGIVRDFCRRNFHRRSEYSLDHMLRQAGVPALADVDTRALAIAIREGGACRGWLGRGDPDDLVARARSLPQIATVDWVQRVSTPKPYTLDEEPAVADPYEVAVLDCGVKKSILSRLVQEGCRVRVFPAAVGANRTRAVAGKRTRVRHLPGPSLARARGATTIKLPFGHHGANHPVQNLATGRVEITSQNHNYVLSDQSLDPTVATVTHRSLNDQSIEGLRPCSTAPTRSSTTPKRRRGPATASTFSIVL